MANMEPMMKFTLPKFDTPNQILIKQKKSKQTNQIKTRLVDYIEHTVISRIRTLDFEESKEKKITHLIPKKHIFDSFSKQ